MLMHGFQGPKCVQFGGYFILKKKKKTQQHGHRVKFNIRLSNECSEKILKGLNQIIPGQQDEVTDSTHNIYLTWKKRKRKKKETGFPQIRTPDFTTMLGFDRELNKSFCGCSTQLNTNKLWHCSEHWISQPAREEFCSKQTWSVMTGLRWECYQSNKHKDIRSLVHSVYLRFHKIWIRLKYIILYH